jgi:hypothetical protein
LGYNILKGIKNIRNHIKKTLSLSALLFTYSTGAHSKIHEFETTHLKSTAGTGVGSILTEESAFLNPAPLAFFSTSSFYFQKDSAKFKKNAINQPDPKSVGFVLADGNPSLSGSLSYVTQEEEGLKRKRWGLSLSAPISDKSAGGISVRQTKDETLSTKHTQKYYQTVLGVTHALDEKFSMGIVAYDPFKSKAHETKALLGFQYVMQSYITASFDLGADYTSEEISKTLIYKGALQVKVLDDFYLRFGTFNDKERSEKGNGFGLSWIQPRLSIEFAIKNTKRESNLALAESDATLKETSFSISARF